MLRSQIIINSKLIAWSSDYKRYIPVTVTSLKTNVFWGETFLGGNIEKVTGLKYNLAWTPEEFKQKFPQEFDRLFTKKNNSQSQLKSKEQETKISKPDRCKPEWIGEVNYKIEPNGQLTIFLDEPPDPDDFANLDSFELAWNEWEKRQSKDVKQCSDTSVCSQVSEDLSEQEKTSAGLNQSLKQNNLSNVIQMPNQSCDRTGQMSQSGMTSELMIPQENHLTLLPEVGLAQTQAMQAIAPELMGNTQSFGEKCLESSVLIDQDLSLWNSLKDLSIEDFEQSLEQSKWQDIQQMIRCSYRQRKSELCTKGTDFLSCPTLMSCSSKKSRPAGTTKLDKWWNQKGLIANGYQLSAEAMALLMGYPANWFEVIALRFADCHQNLLQSPTDHQEELKPDTSQDEQLLLDKQRSHCGEFSTLTPLQSPKNEKNHRAQGWLEKYIDNKKLMDGRIVSYPRCCDRDPDIIEHWCWNYRYEQKSEKAKSKNGHITKALRVPHKKVQGVKNLISNKSSIEQIINFIKE